MKEEIKKLSDSVKRMEENRILYERYTADLQRLRAEEERETDRIQRRDMYFRRAAKESALEELRAEYRSVIKAVQISISALAADLIETAADAGAGMRKG